ncbi:MAG: hypothetical protein IKZ47_00770 [Clostridia bacterium]|nr:hypothetical protein [Clostridia bacterium]
MTFRRILCLFLILAITVSCLAGCGNSNVQYYDENAKILSVESGIIASNQMLELSWDNALKCVLLKNKESGKIWSNVPYDAYLRGENYSTLSIAVQDMQDYQRDSFSSEELVEKNRISCEKIKDGIRLTYYFDPVKISIPVEYTLREDSLKVAIDASKIVEGEEDKRLFYAAPASRFCSVIKDEEDESNADDTTEDTAEEAETEPEIKEPQVKNDKTYIFAPYGTGAIVNTGTLPDGKRKIEKYGRNVAALSTTNPVDPYDDGGLQVFGITDNNDSLMCIAEDCAGAVGIHINAGDRTSEYSSAYPVFYFVDFDDVKGRAANSGDIRQLSERTQSVISVGFYPLSGEDSDYSGMAKRYRKYLIDSGYVKENVNSVDFSSPYAVTFLGGVETTTSVAGVPVTSLKTMTTYKSAQTMLSEMVASIGQKPVVRLQGFGESGINVGQIAGGYTFPSSLGSDSDRMALQKYCGDNGISLYTNFELVKFSKSGSGFSYSFDVAKTATLHVAEQNGVNLPLRDYNVNSVCRLLSREKLSSAVDKLISFANKKSLSGIGVSSLGAISYSDYGYGAKYATTSGMQTDTRDYIKRIVDAGYPVAGSQSTYFAAGLMNAVFESPLETSGMYQIESDIPFYQMVFSGITPLYSASVNLDSNPKRKIMLAAASGTGLGFSLIEDFEKTYMQNNVYELYACVYGKNKDYIRDTVKSYASVYSAVAGSPIKSYEILDDKISKTTFENGTVVYANHYSSPADSPVGELEGYGFKIGSEE